MAMECTYVEAEAYGCDIKVEELVAGKGGGALVFLLAEVALVGEHLVARETL